MRKILKVALSMFIFLGGISFAAQPENLMYKCSATTEKGRSKLDDQIRELIKAYRNSQTAQKYANLREKKDEITMR